MYTTHSRGDVNESLCYIIMEASISPVLMPERLAMELMMLVAILNNNIGMEVGRFILIFNLSIFDCLNNNKRIRHKFFNFVLSSPYKYNIQYDMYYYFIISLKIKHETKNVAIKQNATMEYHKR
jgi:hypothetical protein